MKIERILNNLTYVDDAYIAEAAPGCAVRSISRKKIMMIALAAALALFLVSCGVAAVIFGDSIRSWFGFYWHRITGQEMETEQTAIIDHLSQPIGISATEGKITVTVDSATVSEDLFYLLIRVEGRPFYPREDYNFDKRHLEISPDPMAESGGIGSYGIKYLGIDGDGSALFLLDHQCSPYSGFEGSTTNYEISLSLTDLTSRKNRKNKTLEEG